MVNRSNNLPDIFSIWGRVVTSPIPPIIEDNWIFIFLTFLQYKHNLEDDRYESNTD